MANLEGIRIKIAEASQAYYGGEAIMTDGEFDEMVNILRKESPEDPLLQAIGTGYNINQDKTGKKIPHKYKTVGSLDKINSETCQAYFNKKEHCKRIITSKLDGGSVVIYYDKNGNLEYAATRGDGDTGIDCTNKIKHLVPQKIETEKMAVAVRGEIIMPLSVFNEFYPEAASPRNTAMGILNKIEFTTEELNRLKFVAYNIYREPVDYRARNITLNKSDILEWLARNGFATTAYTSINNSDIVLNEPFLRDFLESRKGVLDPNWPSDGLVVTNEYDCDDEIAYKFQAEQAETTVTTIQWISSRFGNVIPVVHFKPVKLSGATLSKCSGFNAQWIKDNGLSVNSQIIVHRAGEVIPYIKKVVSSAPPALPVFCGVCGTTLKLKGVHLCCENPDCSAKTIPNILLWLYTIAPVDGLGDYILIPLIEWMGWRSIQNIYETTKGDFTDYYTSDNNPTQNAVDLIAKMYERLYEKPIKPADFIVGFGLSGVSTSTAKRVIDEIGLENYFETDEYEPPKELMKMKRITTPAIRSLLENFDYMRKLYFEIKLHRAGFEQSLALNGKIVITGKLSKSRKTLTEEFNSYGYAVVDSVARGVDFLITDNPESGSSKNIAAKRLGVKVISENNFRELLSK